MRPFSRKWNKKAVWLDNLVGSADGRLPTTFIILLKVKVMVICEKCGMELKNKAGLSQHIKTCSGEEKKDNSIYLKNGIYVCPYCGKSFSKYGIHHHINFIHLNVKNAMKGSKAWNKGLTAKNNSIVEKYSTTLRKRFKDEEIVSSFKGRHHTLKTKEVISKKLSINNRGGRCKWFLVNGQKVQGTWERDIAQKLTELGIEWEKIKLGNMSIPYEMEGKKRYYTPDFYLPDFNIFLEVKGFWWGRDREKMNIVMSQTNRNIIIIEEEKYKKILQCTCSSAVVRALV